MAQLTLIHNAFDVNDKTVYSLNETDLNTPLYNVLPKYIKEFENKDYDLVFSVNGVVTDALNVVLRKGDHLGVVPIPAGGGGGSKNILRTVALVALAVVAPYAAGAVMGATAGMVTAGLYGGMSGALIYGGLQAAVIIAGGMLINSLLPVQTPSLSTSSDLQNVSPTYAFSGGSNARQEGTAIPIVLGKARIVPPIISSYLSLQEEKQHLNMLMAVSDGKFDEIHSFNINNQDSTNYTDIDFAIRYGENEQDVIPNFSDNITTVSQNRNINDTSTIVEYETLSNTVDELQVAMVLPKGLFEIQDNGNYTNAPLEFKIEYREVGTSTWYTMQTSETTAYKYRYEWSNGYTKRYYDVDEYVGLWLDTSETGFNSRYHSKYASGSQTVDRIIIDEVYKTTKRIVYIEKNLPQSQYEIRVTRLTEYDTNTRVANDLALEYVNEVTYDDLTYPNVGLLSINAMATDQLSGGFPTISAIVENTYLRYWENDSLITDFNKRLDNPAWASYYILRNAGFNDDNIKLSKFTEWADFCDTKGYKCNLVLDQTMELPDILNMISPLGRAKIVQAGTKWDVIIDTVVSVPTQSFLFTNGNILENSFALDYIPYTDRANVIEVTYYDEDNDYQATTVQAQANNFDATQDEYKTSINYYGCTNKQMAANYAQFLINNNRYISETVTFSTSIESLACNLGDVIKVGVKYITNNLEDGRVLDVNGAVLTLDCEVTFETGKTYQIDIRNTTNDNIYTLDVVNTQNTTNTITVINPPITFEKFDVFSFGESDTQSNLYRVVALTRDGEFRRRISAVEYIPEVYDDTLTIPDEEVTIIDHITNLRATEVLVKNSDGTISEYLDIAWQGSNPLFLEENVYIDNTLVGSSNTNSFLWDNPTRNQTYTIKVGQTTLSHTYVGISDKPDAVTDLSGSESGNVFNLSWNYTKPIDFKHYEIRSNRTSKVFYTNDNFFTTPIINGLGTHSFTVYAVDVLGNKSDAVDLDLVAYAPLGIATVDTSDTLEDIVLSWDYEKPNDFKQFQISVNNKTYFTEDTYFEFPFLADKTIFNIVAEDNGGNKSGGKTVIYNKQPLEDITGLTSYFEGNKLAFSWDRDENINYKYIIKKGINWSIGGIVKETTEEKFYPQSTSEHSIKKTYVNAHNVEFESANAVNFSVEGGLSIQKNVVAVFDEKDDGWNGTKTNVVIVENDDPTYDNTLSTASSVLIDDIADFDNVADLDAYSTVPYGVYEADNVLTLASSQVVKIDIDTLFLAKDIDNLLDFIPNFDGINDFDGNISKMFKINRQISISTDGVIYGDWKNFVGGNYIGKSFKFRVEFYSYDNSVIPYLQDFIITADMEDRLDRGTVTTSSSGYTTKSHSPMFNAVPETICTIVDAQEGDNLILTNETVNGFDVKVRNSGSDVVRTINYVSQGY